MTSLVREMGKLHREQEANANAVQFIQLCKFLAAGKGDLNNSVAAAKSAAMNPRIIDGIKAAVGPHTTAGGLVYQDLSQAFLDSLAYNGVFDGMLPYAQRVPMNQQIAVMAGAATVTADTVPEGMVKLVSQLSLAAQALTPRKSTAIVAASQELLRSAGALGVKIFGAALRKAVATETDRKFLEILANGVVAKATGSDFNAMIIAQDFAYLIGTLQLSSDSKVFIAMSPSNLKHVAVQIGTDYLRAFPTITINGGDYAGATIIPTDALSSTIVAFDATQVAADTDGIQVESSSDASVQLDNAPDSPPTAATPYVSLWQNNLAGIKSVRVWAAERLRTSAVAVISGASWGSANSPA